MIPGVAVAVGGKILHFLMGSVLDSDSDDDDGTSRSQIQSLQSELHAAQRAAQQANLEHQNALRAHQKYVDDHKITSVEKFKECNAKGWESLVEIMSKAVPTVLQGKNIGFIGLTSTGKSTIINKLLNAKVAAVGAGETTKVIQAYDGPGYRLYDMPGKNDDASYVSMMYFSLWKGLTIRLVVITATLKEMQNILELLEKIGLPYDIVVNKCDNVLDEEAKEFRQQIHQEVKTLRLKCVKKIFFISARHTQQFPDWLEMVDYLTK